MIKIIAQLKKAKNPAHKKALNKALKQINKKTTNAKKTIKAVNKKVKYVKKTAKAFKIAYILTLNSKKAQ